MVGIILLSMLVVFVYLLTRYRNKSNYMQMSQEWIDKQMSKK